MRPLLYNPDMVELSDPIFSDEAAARAWLEARRWPEGPVCPYCERPGTARPVGGRSMGAGWYHCRFCRRKFTVRVGTLYERSHVPLHKWLRATRILTDGDRPDITVDMLRYMLDVSYKTAWSMVRRIRDAMRAVAS